jgi:Raf kinase inhibitor-like YbhB/YbcL family protein
MLGKLLRGFKGHDHHLAWNRSDAAPETLVLTSPAFANGTPMPRRHAGVGVGANLSPPLVIAGVPHGTQDLLLVMEDPDAPLPRPIQHLIARLMPATHHLPEGALGADKPVAFGKASFGHSGYGGPRPIPGHGPHRYVFQLFAVSRPLNLPPGAGLSDYLALMQGKVLARGRLTGTYER